MSVDATGPATFVMPYYGDNPQSLHYLRQAVASIIEQSDPDWRLVIIDDGSPLHRADRHVLPSHPRIFLLQQADNRGQGPCRNLGVRWAAEHDATLVLFQDADDLAHPRRLERTRQLLTRQPEVNFVYSTFTVIDEHDRPVAEHELTPSIREILDSHRDAPVTGADAWIRIGTETGYTTLTSTVAVRTELALDQPFPAVRSSEDSHAWLRMSAAGGVFGYVPSIACHYRVPRDVAGSADRARVGADYYRIKAEVDTDGFRAATAIALDRGTIDPSDVPALWKAFLNRLAATMRREGQHRLSEEILGADHASGPWSGEPSTRSR